MNKAMTFSTLMAATVLVAGLGACSGQAESPAVAKAVQPVLVSPGKATAAITVTHNLSTAPEVGQPVELQLQFAAAGGDVLQLQINADEALAAGPRFSRSVSPGESVVIDMVPQAEGRYYVNVIAWAGAGDGAQAKVISIPVQVGKGSYQSQGQKATSSTDGELLIRMPAEENAGG